MAPIPPSFDTPEARRPAPSWSRWSSLVRLAVWGGDARCAECGSREVRRAWTDLPSWRHAVGLDPCHCDGCGATFHVPRRAVTAEGADEPEDGSPEIALPAPPEVDFAALDRDIATRLRRRSS
jgi:hypothetical protein